MNSLQIRYRDKVSAYCKASTVTLFLPVQTLGIKECGGGKKEVEYKLGGGGEWGGGGRRELYISGFELPDYKWNEHALNLV